jgi:tyrosine-protein kinase Etk/Wzc
MPDAIRPESPLDGGTSPAGQNDLGGVHILDVLILLAKYKKSILVTTFGAALIAAIISLMWPHSYTSSARIMPPQQTQSLATLLIGQFGAAGGALNPAALGLKNPSDLYVSILRGRTIADAIIHRFKLKELYGSDSDVTARQALERRVSVTAARDGIITVEVEDRDAARAAEIANAFIEELERLTLNLAVTDAGQRRVFFEKQVRSAKEDLTKAELALRTFLEDSGLAVPEGQAQLTVAAAVQLRAELTAKEIQLSSMRSFAAENNPDLIRAERELASLKHQLARISKNQKSEGGDVLVTLRGVPGAAQGYLQRLRDVKYQEVLFELLAKQYEIARVEEAKNATIVQVIDRAIPSDKRSWPHRTLIVLLAAISAFMLSIVRMLILEKVSKWRGHPDEGPKLATLFGNLGLRRTR